MPPKPESIEQCELVRDVGVQHTHTPIHHWPDRGSATGGSGAYMCRCTYMHRRRTVARSCHFNRTSRNAPLDCCMRLIRRQTYAYTQTAAPYFRYGNRVRTTRKCAVFDYVLHTTRAPACIDFGEHSMCANARFRFACLHAPA